MTDARRNPRAGAAPDEPWRTGGARRDRRPDFTDVLGGRSGDDAGLYAGPSTRTAPYGRVQGPVDRRYPDGPAGPGGPAGPRGPGGPGGPGGPYDPRARGPQRPGRDLPGRKRFIDYPRAGRRGVLRWIPSWRLLLATGFGGLLVLVATFFGLYLTTDIPKVSSSANFQATTVLWADKTLMGRFLVEDRTKVEYDKIPPVVRDAVLAAEDRTFFTNQGVSPTGILRAAWNNARGGARQGASTITQQYVKNVLSSPEALQDRSYTRKIHEFFVSLKVSQTYDKKDILEDYLNTIYFGRGTYGVQAASKAYFGKNVGDLNVSEAAFLAGIINGPELYQPQDGRQAKAAAQTRRQFVLDGMLAQGWVSQAQHDKVYRLFPKIRPERTQVSRNSQTRYMLAMVRAEARTLGFTEDDLNKGGLRIQTTFDPSAVRKASKAVSDVLGPRKSWPKGTEVALSTVDPGTGAVRAIYGGNGRRDQNAVTQDIIEAGSTFKPFGLVAYLEGKGARPEGDCSPVQPGDDAGSLRSRFDGDPGQDIAGFKNVKNFDRSRVGYVDVLQATARSINAAYVHMNAAAGPEHTEQVAICAGLPSRTRGLGSQISNVLGTASPHNIDMAEAYATLANKGRHNPHYVISVISGPGLPGTQEGLLPYRHKSKEKAVFDPGVVADATYAMQKVTGPGGSGSYASQLGRPAAGKTGTSTGSLSAWFAGFTPQASTAVAIYRIGADGSRQTVNGWGEYQGRELTGGSFPVRVWTAFMRAALEGEPVKDLPEPVYNGTPENPAPEPTQEPVEQPTQQPTQQPTEEPTQEPTEQPTEQPEPTEQPTTQPKPTPEPSETPPTAGGRVPRPSPPGGLPRPRP